MIEHSNNLFDQVEAGRQSQAVVPKSDQATANTNRIAELQANVEEVSGILKENVNRILERGQQLDQLEVQSGNKQSHNIASHSITILSQQSDSQHRLRIFRSSPRK